MSPQEESAEAKLLKMIEAQGGGDSASKPQPPPEDAFDVLVFLQGMNRFFLAGIFLLFIVLAYEVFAGWQFIQQDPNSLVKQSLIAAKDVSQKGVLPFVQRSSFYIATVKDRNFFVPYQEKIKKAPGYIDIDPRLTQMVSHLKLVGISWLDSVDSASALIEDTREGVTHFLRSGEKIGDITVKTIYADSVALGYKNEEIIIEYEEKK